MKPKIMRIQSRFQYDPVRVRERRECALDYGEFLRLVLRDGQKVALALTHRKGRRFMFRGTVRVRVVEYCTCCGPETIVTVAK